MSTSRKYPVAPPATWAFQDLRAELKKKIAWFIGSMERRIIEAPSLLLTRRTAPTAPA